MSASTDPAPHTLLKEWLMRLSSPRSSPITLWLAVLATPLFIGQAMAAPRSISMWMANR